MSSFAILAADSISTHPFSPHSSLSASLPTSTHAPSQFPPLLLHHMRLAGTRSPSQTASGKLLQDLPPARSLPSPGDVNRLDGSLPHVPRPSSPLSTLTTLLAPLPPLLSSFANPPFMPQRGPPMWGRQYPSATNPNKAYQGLWAPGDLLAMHYPYSAQPAWINTTARLSIVLERADGGPGGAQSEKH